MTPTSSSAGVPALQPPAWYTEPDAHEEIARLLRWLARWGQLRGVDDAIGVVEEPWKWSEEHAQMRSECDVCEGGGVVVRAVGRRDSFGTVDTDEVTCEACGGTGRS